MSGHAQPWWSGDGERLTSDEDAVLRRLSWFEQLGCELSNAVDALKQGFVGRDRRAEVRDPYVTAEETQRVRTEALGDTYWVQPKK